MQAIFLELVKLSLIGSLFAAAVMLVRLIFPKMPKWLLCLLWGVVALRLICPVSIESSFSLVPDRIASGQIITSIGNEYVGDVNIIYESNAEYSNAVEAGRQPISSDDGYYVVTEKDSLEAPKTVGETLYPILSRIWAAGMVLMLVYTVVSYLMLRRKMEEATHLRDNIWQCEQVDSPFVLGFFKPKIYLPYAITDADMANVIAHEQAHIHRKDHWWKPMGFILLSIHWFNPVLWAAYIMLCRDIEAACDEKVIKHMEKDEMRAYSTALLNCSVNRRRIAACPLAFGEVGVKERVKTVMNYKKPAFWIVIAAVALCIVVAVSFLTNPIGTDEDFDVKLLEYPGLKWGMSPEEVIEALQLTEEQIQSQTYSGGDSATDSCYLNATGFTFFGEHVSIAGFQFSNNGYGYKLFKIDLYLDEDVDMNKVNDTLAETYGKGTGAYYLTYDIDSSGKLMELKAGGDPTLAFLANNLPNGSSKDAQLFRENILSVVNDPEFTMQNWASSVKGTKILPKDGQELIVKFMEENERADRETVLEWLEKVALVSISTANRSLSAAMNQTQDTPSGSGAYATHNQVIYNAGMLIFFTEWIEKLTEEANSKQQDAQVDDPSLLEFPGVKWNATPEDVKENLCLTTDQILVDTQGQCSDLMDTWVLTVTEVPFFGEEVAQAQFQFVKYAGYDKYGLDSLRIYYPDEVDMSEVRDTLIGIYGEGNSIGITRYHISNGKVHSSVDDKLYASSIPDALLYCWESSSKGTDVLPEAVQEEIIAIYTNPDFDNFADRDVVLEYLEKSPLVTLYCTDGAGEGNISADDLYTCNHVNFSAADYINRTQRFGN